MRWIACLAACLVSASALAATLQVSPVRITISADGKAGVVRLHNQSDVPTLVQVEALAWNDAADLAEVPRTNEILAVPPVFEIARRRRAAHPPRPAQAADHRTPRRPTGC